METWIAIAVMSAITIALRAVPLLIRRSYLQKSALKRLNMELPLCVMVVLVLHSLAGDKIKSTVLFPQLIALGVVGLIYVRWRNALLSIGTGLLVLSILTRISA